MRCCVYSRFVYDICYLDIFIEHYIRLGFDKVIILYHDIMDYVFSEKLIEYVEVHKVPNNGNKLPNQYMHLIPKDYDWVLNVDSDEFLILNKKYTSIKDYIEEKLDYDKDINLFQFSWLWVHKFDIAKNSLTDVVYDYKKMVGTKDSASSHIWVKSMAKIDDMMYITCHNFILNKRAVIYTNKRIVTLKNESIPEVKDYEKYNSDDDDEFDEIDKLDLLPRFYKHEKDSYEESFLMHINSRDIVNIFIKGINIHKTQVTKKKFQKKKALKKFINGLDLTQPITKEHMDRFIEIIEYKLQFPMQCLVKQIDINMNDYLVFDYENDLCNTKYYESYKDFHFEIFKNKLLEKYHVLNMDKFYKFLLLIGKKYDIYFRYNN